MMARPANDDDNAVRPNPGTPRLPDLGSVRILVIDDDPQALALIGMALADAPFDRDIELAPNATTGLKRIADDAHDVYLVDQQLPDGTGVDVIRTAKAAGSIKPFILMTGYGSGAIDQAASREGAADYVEKHMVGAHLERSIRYAMRNWQAARLLHVREEQLRHAQKMEAIGRLAGAIAHDFNNMLTTIIGYAELLGERFERDAQTASDVAEIRIAADRAGQLTRQLLAFSRKQFLNTAILDLNDTAAGLIQMLPSVVGEQIKTTTRLADALGKVKADAAQIEQVLVNLVLNARDAMPLGGELTIETANVELDAERIEREHLSLRPGPYALLAVRDSGVGMDAETRAHAFEPFFTTKAKGQGSGLGLATAYGIIDQSGGGISIETSPGHGTTVRVYLPVTSSAAAARADSPVPLKDSGSETLLVVDDNDGVRAITVKALRRRGYTVFESRTAEEAIDWASTSGIRPHLLVTDVVMPGLNGPTLAARLLQQNPGLRVLYISGYTDESSVVDGSFWGDIPLLQKPFTPAQLAERVRLTLDASAGQA